MYDKGKHQKVDHEVLRSITCRYLQEDYSEIIQQVQDAGCANAADHMVREIKNKMHN